MQSKANRLPIYKNSNKNEEYYKQNRKRIHYQFSIQKTGNS